MSFVLRTPSQDIDLGPAMAVLSAFGEMGRLEPGEEYGQLHYVPQTNEEEVPEEYVAQVREQAQQFLQAHREELSEFAVGVLEQLAARDPHTIGAE